MEKKPNYSPREFVYFDEPSQKDLKEFVKNKLATDKKWAMNALLRIYERQTEEEKQVLRTVDHNGIGFSGTDSRILSSMAKQLKEKKFLSPKQMVYVFKLMPKYWSQIIEISDKKKLYQAFR